MRFFMSGAIGYAKIEAPRRSLKHLKDGRICKDICKKLSRIAVGSLTYLKMSDHCWDQ